MDHLNLNSLRVFAAAARQGSFQRAAEALHLTQGAVSQRVKQLEGDLGVVLFERTPRGVRLTGKGAEYLRAVDEALGILTAATAALSGPGERVVLHLGASFAAKWLMPRMQAFRARFPDLQLSTETHEAPLERSLGRREIAIWPAANPARNPAHHQRVLSPLRLVAVCSPALLRPDWPLDVEALLSLPLLQDAHRRWERLIAETGHRRAPTILNFDRSALALDAAMQGHGVAIAPELMIEADIRARRLVELWRDPRPTGEAYHIAWARQHERERAVRQVVDWLLGEFGATA